MENQALEVVHTFIDQLAAQGCRHLCISPGSRSTPLTISASRHPDMRVWMLLDERSAAYFALGLARSTEQPVALVCTSGTAVANYLPAVVEAYHARVPLLLLTADRPSELRGVGSNQTIDQANIFSTFVKGFLEMPVPDGSLSLKTHAKAVAVRVVALASGIPEGPVQVNFPFREPLIPPPASDARTAVKIPVLPSCMAPSEEAISFVCAALQSSLRPLIIVGPQPSCEIAESIVRFAKTWNIPMLVDPLSQIRTLGDGLVGQTIITSYDLLLRHQKWQNRLQPDCVIRFGETPTSKVLGQFLQSASSASQIVVDTDVHYRDPFFTASCVIQANPAGLVNALAAETRIPVGHAEWTTAWGALEHIVREVSDAELSTSHQHEGRVFVELARVMPNHSLLFVGNSMPVRDADSGLGQTKQRIRVLGNRGASGIDGVISTALGASAGQGGKTALVIGDVSFYHDLNSLLIAAKHDLDLVIVLVHNDGGGIFSFLPQVAANDVFHTFQTPHGVDFSGIQALFGWNYRCVSFADLAVAVKNALTLGGRHVIVLETDTPLNVAAHRALDACVSKRLEGMEWPANV